MAEIGDWDSKLEELGIKDNKFEPGTKMAWMGKIVWPPKMII